MRAEQMNPTVLDEIAAYTRTRVAAQKARRPLAELQTACASAEYAARIAAPNPFEAALRQPGVSFICEVKQASPSKGTIVEEFPYIDIARDYERSGADAVSCLTEPRWFRGSDEIFSEIRDAVALPMLRKDFTVDAYQIYQARLLGADAVLLICALLDEAALAGFLELCDQLGLAALVETHDEDEIARALNAGARIIGVNNRNLKDFSVDFENAARLRSSIPQGHLFVAESGVSSPTDAAHLAQAGADAILVGEFMMRAADRAATLAQMRRCCS
jgi:indole-3-glycerol phosphate synthase